MTPAFRWKTNLSASSLGLNPPDPGSSSVRATAAEGAASRPIGAEKGVGMMMQPVPPTVRRLSHTLVAAGLLAALLGAVSAPATASPDPVARSTPAVDACPFPNTLCLFEGTNFTGERLTLSSLVSPGTCVSLVDAGWGDRARSAINTNSRSAAMFMNDDCAGGPSKSLATAPCRTSEGSRPKVPGCLGKATTG
ncbi:peptidase inhibitor family I36 protein [Micromonospora haikouensis]|uniref:peptidase inhibitor family I36 protein n=1 Tax=Micromonospora haikouensis TaxID=686309 RepID=UPI0036A0BFC3